MESFFNYCDDSRRYQKSATSPNLAIDKNISMHTAVESVAVLQSQFTFIGIFMEESRDEKIYMRKLKILVYTQIFCKQSLFRYLC